MTTSTPLTTDTGNTLSGRNSLEGFDVLPLLGVLAAAQQSGALRIERPAPNTTTQGQKQQFTIWLQQGRVTQASGPYNLSGPAALAELLRVTQGNFHFKTAELAPNPHLNLSTDMFGYQALLLLPAPPMPPIGAVRVLDPKRLTELELEPKEIQWLQRLDEGQPLSDITIPATKDLVARLLLLGILAERRLRVARMVVRLTHELHRYGIIDEAIYQVWSKVKGKKLTRIQMRLDTGEIYLLPITARPNLGAVLLLPPDILIKTGIIVGDAVLLRPEPFLEESLA